MKKHIFLLMLSSAFCTIEALKLMSPGAEADYSEKLEKGKSLRATLLRKRQNWSSLSLTTEELISNSCNEFTKPDLLQAARVLIHTPRIAKDIHPDAIQLARENAAKYPSSACAQLAEFWEMTNKILALQESRDRIFAD